MRADQGQTVPPNGAGAASRTRGAGARLASALRDLAGGHGTLVSHRQRSWASITFTGTRHELAFRFEGGAAVEAGERLIAQASEHEFAIPRQLVADVAVSEVDHVLLPEPSLMVRLEVLLLEEG